MYEYRLKFRNFTSTWKDLEIDRLQRAETDFATMSAPFFSNLPKSLSAAAALELLIPRIIFKTYFLVVPIRQKSAVVEKLE